MPLRSLMTPPESGAREPWNWIRTWLPVTAALLASGTFAILVSRRLIHPNLTSHAIATGALTMAGAAFVAALLSGWLLGRVSRERYPLIANSLVILWAGPVAILLRMNSPWAMPAVCVLAFGIVLLLRPEGEEPLPVADPPPFRMIEDLRRKRSLCIAVLIQFAILSMAAGMTRVAAALAAIAAGLIAAVWVRAPQTNIRLRAAVSVLGSVAILSAGLTRYLERFYGGGSTSDPPSEERRREPEPRRSAGTITIGDAYPGIILWPEAEKHTVLIPPLPAIGVSLGKPGRNIPLSIPFFGVYEFYRAADRRLPRNSLVARGRPDEMSFRSTDRSPMVMEARQNIGTFLPMACCSRLQVGVYSTDKYFGTVDLEVVLRNSEVKNWGESLGKVRVGSDPSWWRPGHHAQEESLAFPMPASPSLDRFDEFDVRFHLSEMRADQSARVHISRFVLVPR